MAPALRMTRFYKEMLQVFFFFFKLLLFIIVIKYLILEFFTLLPLGIELATAL